MRGRNAWLERGGKQGWEGEGEEIEGVGEVKAARPSSSKSFACVHATVLSIFTIIKLNTTMANK